MNTTATIATHTRTASKGFAIDTSFVLFFLGLEFGRTTEFYSVDSALMLVTTVMFLVLPHFIPTEADKPEFGAWIAGRAVIALFGATTGVLFGSSLGRVFPDSTRFLPMTLLIAAAIISSFVQF